MNSPSLPLVPRPLVSLAALIAMASCSSPTGQPLGGPAPLTYDPRPSRRPSCATWPGSTTSRSGTARTSLGCAPPWTAGSRSGCRADRPRSGSTSSSRRPSTSPSSRARRAHGCWRAPPPSRSPCRPRPSRGCTGWDTTPSATPRRSSGAGRAAQPVPLRHGPRERLLRLHGHQLHLGAPSRCTSGAPRSPSRWRRPRRRRPTSSAWSWGLPSEEPRSPTRPSSPRWP
jgi:hypothetical protein